MSKPEVLFVLSIDTEEEWHWDDPFPEHSFAVENVKYIPPLQKFCDNLGIRPTYFVDYPVLDDARAVKYFKQAVAHNRCEVGGHLPPWCNPPYFGETTEFESHVVNLPTPQVAAKLDRLIDKVQSSLGLTMTSFRTGRWGINDAVLGLLKDRGFLVDSSVYPLYKNEHFSCLDAPLGPYWPDLQDPNIPGQQRSILELPVTVGFNHGDFKYMRKLSALAEHSWLEKCRSVAFLWHTKLLRKTYLSPELSSVTDMQNLMQASLQNDAKVIHMYLHSSSLLDGATGFYEHQNAFASLTNAIKESVQYLQNIANVKFATITEATHLLEMRKVIPESEKLAMNDFHTPEPKVSASEIVQ